MAEEEKKECCKAASGVKSIMKILIGIALIVLGAYLCFRWLPALLVLIKGCLGPFFILIGLVFLAIAKE